MQFNLNYSVKNFNEEKNKRLNRKNQAFIKKIYSEKLKVNSKCFAYGRNNKN